MLILFILFLHKLALKRKTTQHVSIMDAQNISSLKKLLQYIICKLNVKL